MRLAFATLLWLMAVGFSVPVAAAPQATEISEQKATSDGLSISAELALTTLAASAHESLTLDQLCDRGGICGVAGQADLAELVRRGLITSASAGTFQLTAAGARYVNQHFVITRNGDELSFETRDEDR